MRIEYEGVIRKIHKVGTRDDPGHKLASRIGRTRS